MTWPNPHQLITPSYSTFIWKIFKVRDWAWLSFLILWYTSEHSKIQSLRWTVKILITTQIVTVMISYLSYEDHTHSWSTNGHLPATLYPQHIVHLLFSSDHLCLVAVEPYDEVKLTQLHPHHFKLIAELGTSSKSTNVSSNVLYMWVIRECINIKNLYIQGY